MRRANGTGKLISITYLRPDALTCHNKVTKYGGVVLPFKFDIVNNRQVRLLFRDLRSSSPLLPSRVVKRRQ